MPDANRAVRMGPGGLGFGWCCTARERTADSTQHPGTGKRLPCRIKIRSGSPSNVEQTPICRPARGPSVTPSLRRWDFTDMGDQISRSTQPPSTNPTGWPKSYLSQNRSSGQKWVTAGSISGDAWGPGKGDHLGDSDGELAVAVADVDFNDDVGAADAQWCRGGGGGTGDAFQEIGG